MKIRIIAVAAGLCVSLSTAACASTVGGQAEIGSGAVVPTTSRSAPSPFPDPTGGGSSTSSDSPGTGTSAAERTTDDPAVTQTTPTSESSSGDDTSVGPTSATSIPGLSKDCNAVLAGITAFSSVLQGAGSSGEINQTTVDDALRQLPASGLPTRPQADITVLRTAVEGAVGKTLGDLSRTMTDGNVVDALQDLSSWAEQNCA